MLKVFKVYLNVSLVISFNVESKVKLVAFIKDVH